ncbi:hypothetical protein ACRQ1B_02675 [Rhizobium panacihumi]|uniref:hypothetical protein n=1 Tax=Rhizobium panacihumi TaxID=2008450 RepID=UPI003D7B2D57
MSDSCPVLPPAQRHLNNITHRAGEGMMETVLNALDAATKQVAEEWQAADTTDTPPPYEYFAAVVHQRMFLLLCGADAETMKGGNPVLAGHLIRNQQNIAEHYWTDGRDGTADGAAAEDAK